MSNIKKDSLSQDKKLHRTKIAATISVVISLILLIGFLSFQVYWNIFRFRFVKDGCAVIIDNQLAIGVEKIIRGEEANQIFLEKNAGNQEIEKGYEVVLVKVKVKNISFWNAYPGFMEFNLYTKKRSNSIFDASHYTMKLTDDVVISTNGEYKTLDNTKVFRPGEIRDGAFYFEVEKEKSLSNVDVKIFNKNNEIKNRKSISLSRILLSKRDIFLLLSALFFLLFWFMMITLLKKRKEKRVGYTESWLFYCVMRPWFSFYISMATIILLTISELTWLTIFFTLVVTGIFFINYLRLRKYLFLFYWLKKEDLTYITTEFKKRIGWESSEMMDIPYHFEPLNRLVRATFPFS